MKFRFFLAGASAATVASFAAVTACSGTDTPAPVTTGGGATVPTATGTATQSKARQVFAARKVFLGDTDRNGTSSDGAWRKYGYDIDDKRTTQRSKDACLPAAGGPPVADGDNGIDNSFGGNVLGILKTGLPTPTETTQKAIDDGDFTLLMDFTGLTDDAKQTNIGLSGQVLVPGPFDMPGAGPDAGRKAPNWADPMTLDIPVRSNLIVGNDPAKSLITFTEVYVTGGLLVGKAKSIDLTLAVGGINATFSIKNAVVTANHATPNTLTNGTIVGVLEVDRLKSLIGEIGPKLTDQLCPGSGTLKTATDALNSYGDIMVNAANGPGTCDGISIALGFEAVQVMTPSKVYVPEASTPGEDKCAAPVDAGMKDAAMSSMPDAAKDAK